MRIALRVVIGLLIIAAIVVAIVPLLVILDIRDGGSGWGLCLDGFDVCRNSYFSGFEFLAVYVAVLFGILALIAGAVRLMRIFDRREARKTLGREMAGTRE